MTTMNKLICCRCKELKDNTDFHKSKSNKTGHQAMCKECSKKYNSSEKRKKYAKQYYQEHKEEYRKRDKKYYYENKEKVRNIKKLMAREIYKKDKEKVLEKNNKYFRSEKGKETLKNLRNRRKSQKKKIVASFTKDEWNECKKYFNNACCYCGKQKLLTQEHFIPLVKKGEYTKQNILPACINCNSSKGDRDFNKWYKSHESFSPKRKEKILKYLKAMKGGVNSEKVLADKESDGNQSGANDLR